MDGYLFETPLLETKTSFSTTTHSRMAIPQVQLHPQGPTVSQLIYGTWRLANSNGFEDDPSLATPESVLERIEACKYR
jgi:hypothetical protein